MGTTTSPADKVEMAYELVARGVRDDSVILNDVKAYAAAYNQFQLAKIAEELQRAGHFRAAEAVSGKRDVLLALERGA